MREERIELSQKERDRLKVLHEVEQGHVKQVEASLQLELSTCQRATLGWQRVGPLPPDVSYPAALPGAAAVFHNPFRPTASRRCGQPPRAGEEQKQNPRPEEIYSSS